MPNSLSRRSGLSMLFVMVMLVAACGGPSAGEVLSKKPEASLLYPGAEVTNGPRILESSQMDPGTAVTLIFVTPDSLEQVLASYSEALKSRGWSGPQTKPKTLDPTQYYWTKGDLTFLVFQLDETTSAADVTRPGKFLYAQMLSERAK